MTTSDKSASDNKQSKKHNRRGFITEGLKITIAGGIPGGGLLTSCKGKEEGEGLS
jgi:hypothetical protein